MEQNKISGAEAVVLSLLEENIEVIFGYPGGTIMPVYDALYDYMDRLNHVLVRHEQGAIHAAEGYARASGKVGVCIATSGPGATNLITGLADAMVDSTPLVCITGQVGSGLLGTDAFQETDVIGISMPVTKWNIQVTKSNEIADAIARAFFIAKSGRPGPVLVDITKDAQFGQTEYQYKKCTSIRSYVHHPELNKSQIKEAAALINNAKKPLVLVGQGVMLSCAEAEFLEFAEKTNMPVANTLLGIGAFPVNHRLHVGNLGMHGNYAPNMKTNECDVLIAVGMRFDDRVTGDVKRYANQAKIIHIDIDKSEFNKNIKVDIALHADAKEALSELNKLIKPADHSDWIQEFSTCKQFEFETLALHETPNDALRMWEVVKMLSDKTEGKAVIVTDVGQHQMTAFQHYNYQNTRSSITSGGLGTMGFALPAAIGAKFACPEKEIIAIIGDGGFQMTLQELGTILQTEIAVKIIILNNNFLGMVRQWQQLFFDKRYSFTDLKNPDFTKIADAYGIESAKISHVSELENAIDKLLNHKGSYLLEAVVEREENIFPMIPAGSAVSEIRLK